MNLHDKYKEKKESAKQKKLDEGQDKQIKDLRSQVDRLQSKGDDDNNSSRVSRSRPRLQSRRSLSAGDYEEEDFDRSARKSRAMIEREFDANVRRLGSTYAQGDVIAENKLQAQVIQLQQTVINVLQDALLNDRKLSKADIHRLISAQDNARQGSLDALRDQYDRMIQDQPQQLAIENNNRRNSRQLSPIKRQTYPPGSRFARGRWFRSSPTSSNATCKSLRLQLASPLLSVCRRSSARPTTPLASLFLVFGNTEMPCLLRYHTSYNQGRLDLRNSNSS